jgi:hypothetical protein
MAASPRHFRFSNRPFEVKRSPGSFLEIDKGKRGPGGVADAARTGGAQMLMAVEEM